MLPLVLRLTGVFLSTPSARRATVDACNAATEIIKFLSTPSARRATTMRQEIKAKYKISIHALREEGDERKFTLSFALREEGDSPSGA